ncbi:MAG TPA: NAD(P)/FAD-dependent oxidoreductase [Pseudomonadales bacterium]|nr:NAD(P)/FAD-dependent oxidoreductase [Pseudomonadales bacterium]
MSLENTQGSAVSSYANLGFDPDALRDRYRAERDKRVRADGNDQYREVTGEFARYLDDPYVEPGFQRAPLTDEVEVIVIGGGFGGLLAGARLREAGVRDIRIIEKGGDFGGTWYWNRYPGAQCDIESYIYLPLLEELQYVPIEKYTHAPEILKHSRAIGEHYRLYDNACFQTEVTELRWDDAAARWIVKTNRGDAMRAKFIAMSNGPLNRPKLPAIPGVETFKGHTFHTSRWDYDYTGGDSTGNLSKLSDKRVAIIGTGATAVQCVPHLGEAAKQLYVFQRTPSSVDVRNNRRTESEWANSLKPGWQQHRMTNFNVLVTGGFQEEDLVADGWTDIIRNLGGIVQRAPTTGNQTPEEMAALVELADFQKMEQVRARVDAIVKDPATAAALKPYYRQFCKRPCFHDEYLQTFNRPNVKLVDTQGKGVERITENAVVVDGKAYEVDCIIFATGFEVGTAYTRRAGYEVVGRGGVTLTDKWAKGLASYHGFLSRGFPNCFFMGITQGGFTANFPHMLNEQALHVAYIVKQAMDRQARTVEPSQAAESGWVATMESKKNANLKFLQECTPGYYNNEGRPGSGTSLLDAQYGGGPEEFFKIIRDWRAEGSMQGIEVA